MITIYDSLGNVRYTTAINSGSVLRKRLMSEDYIMLRFAVADPIPFERGDYAIMPFGRYEVVDITYSDHNSSTGGYTYELRLDAYYWKWKNKILCYDRQGNKETSWRLTRTPDAHLSIVCSNLADLGYHFADDVPFTFAIDASVDMSPKLVEYVGINIIDALTLIAETWDAEWWIQDNIIHLGRCEYGSAVPLEHGREIYGMSRSESSDTFATRIIAFGSSRNLPPNYRGNQDMIVEGIVQKRLMLPVGTPYVDAYPDMRVEEAVEGVVIFDDVYPRRIGTMDNVTTKEYTDTIEHADGTTTDEVWDAYRFKDSGLIFSEDYVLPGEELRIVFTSGALNGMDFAVWFNPDGETGAAAQVFEIVRSDDYGTALPNDTLKPVVGDKYILHGFDTRFVSESYLPAAEQELKQRAEAWVEKTKQDPSVYECNMNVVALTQGDIDLNVGDRVNIVHRAYFPQGRESRIYGFEKHLDGSQVTYTVGNTARYSRLAEVENQIKEITYNNNVYSGSAGMYVVGKYDKTVLSDRNVLSSLRALNEITARSLSRLNNDNAAGHITFDEGLTAKKPSIFRSIVLEDLLQSERFVPGFVGEGMKFWTDETGETHGELDYLTIRKTMDVFQLMINKIQHVGGSFLFSDAAAEIDRVDELSSVYRCYVKNPDTNFFTQFDQAICQTFQRNTTWRYWRLVTNVAADYSYVDLSKTDCEDGSQIPAAGDEIIQLGHRSNPVRQNAILVSSYGNVGAYQQFLKGIDSFSLVGKVKIQIGDETFFEDVSRFSIRSGNGQSYRVPVDRGAWSPVTYYYYDRVSHAGSIWLCVAQPSTTLEPSDDSEAWEKQVSRGEQGEPGQSNEFSLLLSSDTMAIPATTAGVANLANAEFSVRVTKSGKEVFPNYDESVPGRNLRAASNNPARFAGYQGAEAVKSVVSVPEWNATDANRVQTTGGTNAIKGLASLMTPPAGITTQSCWFKNNGDNTLIITPNGGTANGRYDLQPGEAARISFTGTFSTIQFQVRTGTIEESADFTWWRTKVEVSEVATDWTPAPEELLTTAIIVPVNCTTTITDTDKIRITSVSADSGSVDITVNYGDGYTATKRFTWVKTKQGEKGEPGNDGTGVTILGSYDTYPQLVAAHPTGNPGDSYLVAGDLYVWSANQSGWENVGRIKGDQGIPGVPGADGQTTYTWIRYADTPTTGMSADPTGKIYIGVAFNKLTPTPSNIYSDYAWSRIKGDTGDKGDRGEDTSTGKMLYKDPTFKSGFNNTVKYINSGGEYTSWERVGRSIDCPTDSNFMMKHAYNGGGTVSPAYGGFRFSTPSRANAVFIAKIIAKIPVGYRITFAGVTIGTGNTRQWLTSQEGTGRFETYIHKAVCGADGTFGGTNLFYFQGNDQAFEVSVAYATVFDLTTYDYFYDEKIVDFGTKFDQTDDKLSLQAYRMIEAEGRIDVAETRLMTTENRLSDAELKITPDAINATVRSQTETLVTTAVDDLQIGGRNLRADSNSPARFAGYQGAEIIKSVVSVPEWGATDANRVQTTGGTSTLKVYTGNMYTVNPGEIITQSCWFKNNGTVAIIITPNGGVANGRYDLQPGEATRVVFTPPPGNTQFQVRTSTVDQSTDITWWRIQVEKGNKATDWTPAQEDTEGLITTAQGTANTAVANAASAQTAANNAQTTANTAITRITAAELKITDEAINLTVSQQVSTKVDGAIVSSHETIRNEFAIDTSGISMLGKKIALTGMVTFSSLAPDAQGKVNSAQATADTAQNSANGAQTTANTAVTNAATAQTTADTAKANADVAQLAAQAAQTTANNAVNNAAAAQTSANTANSLLSDISNDNRLTPDEKQDAKKEWDIIQSEYSKITSQAATFGVASSAYTSAYNALSSYITPLLSSLITTSNITGTTFRSNFKAYYDARTDLLNVVAMKTKTLADTAQTAADVAQSSALTAQTAANAAQSNLTALISQLGGMAYQDMVSLAKLDQTIVEGGYIKTTLIDADTLITGSLLAAKIAATDITTGRLTVTSGAKIGGLIVAGDSLTNEGLDNDAYIVLRNDIASTFVGIGANVMGSTSGYNATGRFENSRNDTVYMNLGINVVARNSTVSNQGLRIETSGATSLDGSTQQHTGNHAIFAIRGDYAGFRMRTRRVNASQTLSNMDNVILCINTSTITLTLPSSPEEGQIFFIQRCSESAVNMTVGTGTHRISWKRTQDGVTTTAHQWYSVVILIWDKSNLVWRASTTAGM